MAKKPSKTSVSLLLDKYERAICLELAGDKCENPGCAWAKQPRPLQWCHIVKRARKALRWDRNNTLILCVGCHNVFDNMLTDRQRYKFVNLMKPDVYNHLDQQIGLKFELTLSQMLELLEMKKQELKELRGK